MNISWIFTRLLLSAILILPCLTWWTLVDIRPSTPILQTPTYLLLVVMQLLAVAWIACDDAWMGIFALWVVIRSLFDPWIRPAAWDGEFRVSAPTGWSDWSAGSLDTNLWVLGGAAMILASRRLTEAPTRQALEWLAIGQLLALSAQALGFIGNGRFVGTLGQENAVGVVLGMIAPIARSWLMVGLLGGLWLTTCVTGFLALVGGLARSMGVSWRGIAWGFFALLAGLIWWITPGSLAVRQRAWTQAMHDQSWWTWLVGHGWGSWAYGIAQTMDQGEIRELFIVALNEPVQLYYEGGLVGLLLAGAWVYHHRDCWTGPWGGAALAVGLTTLAWSTFHYPIPALVALVILGQATKRRNYEMASRMERIKTIPANEIGP